MKKLSRSRKLCFRRSRKLRLSIVILNHNTEDLLRDCLSSLKNVREEVDFETIVVDNGSTDRSREMVKEDFPNVRLIENKLNLGFAKGNNSARRGAAGECVLFLNSDTKLRKNTLKETMGYLESHEDVGALTCKIELPDGSLDKDAMRSFPTPWVAFTHFSYLDRVFPHSKLFSRYWYGYKSPEQVQEVDALQGAFFLVRKRILDEVGWFDEDYFLDGEDIDLCWKIKEKGWKIVYYPKVSIDHVKGATKGKVESLGKITKEEKVRYVNAGVDSMEIFYKKRLWEKYPALLGYLVILGIKTLKGIRYIKAFLS